LQAGRAARAIPLHRHSTRRWMKQGAQLRPLAVAESHAYPERPQNACLGSSCAIRCL
jgi:hypothetical protein